MYILLYTTLYAHVFQAVMGQLSTRYNCAHMFCRYPSGVSMSYNSIGDYTGGEHDFWSWAHLKTFIGEDDAVEYFCAGEASVGPVGMHQRIYPCPLQSLWSLRLTGYC